MLVLPRQLTKQIEEEKDVILREYHRKYEHEQSRSWALQGRPWLFEHHPRLNAYHCALGIPDEFLQSTQKDIQNYYDMYYVLRLTRFHPVGKGGRTTGTIIDVTGDTLKSVQNIT